LHPWRFSGAYDSIPASSGKTNRHRLNRGGDLNANAALWRIAVVRLSCDQRTRDSFERSIP